MIATAPIVLEATAEVLDDAGDLPDGGTDADRDGDGCADSEAAGNSNVEPIGVRLSAGRGEEALPPPVGVVGDTRLVGFVPKRNQACR